VDYWVDRAAGGGVKTVLNIGNFKLHTGEEVNAVLTIDKSKIGHFVWKASKTKAQTATMCFGAFKLSVTKAGLL